MFSIQVFNITQKFSDTLWPMEKNFLQLILPNLYSTKCIDVKVCHSDVQKHVSYTRSHKRFLIYYGLCLRTAGNVFSILFHGVFLLY